MTRRFHLRMQSGLEADVHFLLCIAIAGCVAAVVAEAAMVGTGAFAPTVARAFFTLLQGTWFFQTARILSGAPWLLSVQQSKRGCGLLLTPPHTHRAGAPWDQEDSGNALMLPVIFAAHILVGAGSSSSASRACPRPSRPLTPAAPCAPQTVHSCCWRVPPGRERRGYCSSP